MLKIAEDAGIKAIKRPTQYADESVPFGMFLEYVCDIVGSDHVMWACATSPCVEPYLYNKAIKLYFEKLEEGYDSLITCSPYQTYLMDEKGPLVWVWRIRIPSSSLCCIILQTELIWRLWRKSESGIIITGLRLTGF